MNDQGVEIVFSKLSKSIALCFLTTITVVCGVFANYATAQTISLNGAATSALKANGKIAFVRQRNDNGKSAIFTINPDGSALTQITNNQANDDSPAWSPDGTRIAFVSDRDGKQQIYVMNADGTNQTRLTNDARASNSPAWSPDGKHIAFGRTYSDGEIFVMNADGGNLVCITSVDPFNRGAGHYFHPNWSPDGKTIIVDQSSQYGTCSIDLSTFDYSANQILPTKILYRSPDGYQRYPFFAPDGTRIVVSGEGIIETEIAGLFVGNADGSGLTLIGRGINSLTKAVWSPDGTQIAYDNFQGKIFTRRVYQNSPQVLTDGTRPTWQPLITTAPSLPTSFVQFSQPFYDGLNSVNGNLWDYQFIFVTRSGTDRSDAAWVDYESKDETAMANIDYLPVFGTLYFPPGESRAIIPVHVLGGDGKNFGLTLKNPRGNITLDEQSSVIYTINKGSSINPIDASDHFVRQQYNDILNRYPDSDGWNFWQQQINRCGADTACIQTQRTRVSGAFFLSIEFQESGFWSYRFYRDSFGRVPRFQEFLPDVLSVQNGVVVGQTGWQEVLEKNKRAFADAWTQRQDFKNIFDNKSNADYVLTLLANAGLPSTNAANLTADLDAGRKTRAQVLRAIIDDVQFARQEYNRTFVLMQYFCYLRRNPDDAPDNNLDGYNFWLSKFNQFGGDYERAEMVKAFIVSREYRSRFGNP